MPKRIELTQRKEMIAEAAWKVILAHGMEGASVRNIAKEAGLSLGALRHYFASQNELLNFARDLVYQKTAERMGRVFKLDMPPKEKIVQVLLDLMPAAGETKLEAEVRLVFKIHARHKGGVFDAEKDSVYLAIKEVMSYLVLLNLLKKEADLYMETERMYSLLDGLALDGIIRPQLLETHKLKRIIVYHLNSICSEDF